MYGMEWELSKLKIADFHREAAQDRLAAQVVNHRDGRAIDAVPFRARVARLLGAPALFRRGAGPVGA